MVKSGENSEYQQKVKDLINKRDLTELAHLVETEKIPIPQSLVRMGYKNYLYTCESNKVKLFLLMKLKEITGVMPEELVLIDACELAMNMDSPQILESLVKRLDINKELFKKHMGESIQKIYRNLIRYGKFMDISKLMEITATSPSEELIQEGYAMYLKEVKFISFTGLKKQTHLEPNRDMVLQMYQFYHESLHDAPADQEETWLRRLSKLKELTGIEPPENIAFELDLDI